MKKRIVMGLFLLALLVACSAKPEVSGRKVTSPTGAVVAEPPVEPEPEASVQEKTAAEALAEEKSKAPATVAKQGSSLYPPIVSSKQGKDALQERTRAAFSKSSFNESVDAEKDFGPKYFDDDGDAINLPDDYGEGGFED